MNRKMSGFPFNPSYFDTGDELPGAAKKTKKKNKKQSNKIQVENKSLSALPVKASAARSTSGTPLLLDSSNLPQHRPIMEARKRSIREIETIPPIANPVHNKTSISTGSTFRVLTSPVNDRTGIIIISGGGIQNVFISGICTISLLKGIASVNGFSLPMGTSSYKVQSNIWQPALCIQTIPHSSSACTSSDRLVRIIQNDNLRHEFPVDTRNELGCSVYDCTIEKDSVVLLIRGFEWSELSWIESAEDYSKYDQSYLKRVSSDVWSFSSGIVSTLKSLDRLNIDHMDIPLSWESNVELVKSHTTSQKRHPKIVCCGAKGVGKSTCLRYTVNELLSYSDKICVIDCDVGQPELSVPGVISMHIVSEPLLVPSHMNIPKYHNEAELQVFIGDVTSKSDPELLVTSFGSMIKRYEEIIASLLPRAKKDSNKMKNTKLSDNPFALLDEDEDADTDTTVELLPETFNTIPLVINCDGNIRFTGSDILSAIIMISEPTHVFQLMTEKDRDLVAISQLKPDHQTHCILDPARTTPSKIVSGDIRILRFLSYFLLEPEAALVLKPRTNPIANLPSLLHDNTTSGNYYQSRRLQREQSAESIDAAAVAETSGDNSSSSSINVCIRNAAVIDPVGYIAMALLHLPAFAAPLETLAFRILDNPVVPRLTLAAFNASIVGISYRVNSATETEAVAAAEIGRKVKLHHPSSDSTFTLDCDGSSDDLHCLGLGVVRSIDVANTQLFLITPCDVSRLKARESVYLLKGALQLPMCFTLSPAFPTFPYMSGEVFGEGSAAMKSRTNIKRRVYI